MRLEDLITNTAKKSWDLFKKQFVALIVGSLIALILMIFIVTIPPLVFGIYYMCVQMVNGKKIQIKDVFKGFRYFWRSWGIAILALLGIAIGLVLLIIPGLILIVLWQYVIAVSLIENLGVIDSLKRSYNLAKNNFAFSIVFLILTAVLSSLGGITRIGILLTIPFTTLWTVVAAKALISQTKSIKASKPVKKKKKR
ncbi:MAG: hypothetical protein ABIE22_03135 [archaeon]